MLITQRRKKWSIPGTKNLPRASSVNCRKSNTSLCTRELFRLVFVFSSTRLGLSEFFAKYATYGAASDAVFAILRERALQRDDFWRNRSEAILSENRLQGLAERVQAVRSGIVKNLQERADGLLERFLPKVDQSNIDKRIADYVGKLVVAFEQFSKRNTEQWKAIFKAIDTASQGPDNKWFRTLVADIDSAAFAAAADAESTKLFKKLGDSSKLLINNIQQLSRGITKRREGIRERVKNAIRHIPKVRRECAEDRIASTFSCVLGLHQHDQFRITLPRWSSTRQLRRYQ